MHKSGDKLRRVIVDLTEHDRIVASLHADEVGGASPRPYVRSRNDSGAGT